MKKTMLVLTICFVVITVAVFFLYPYLQYPEAADLEGVYIRSVEHEYGREWDTLVLRRTAASDSRYLITRRWNYERTLDGRVLAPEYKKKATTASYLEKEALLVDEESGMRYSFHRSRNELMAGTTVYKKIN